MNKITAAAAAGVSAAPETESLENLVVLLEAQASEKQRTAELLRELAASDKTIRVGANVTLFGKSSSVCGLWNLHDHPKLEWSKRGPLEPFITGERYFTASSVEWSADTDAKGVGKSAAWVDEDGGHHHRIAGVWRLVADIETGEVSPYRFTVFELVTDD